MYAEHVHELYLRVVAIGRQEMHAAALLHSVIDNFIEAFHGSRSAHACLGSKVAYRLHAAIPNDVVNVDFVAVESLNARIGIYDAHESVAVLGKEIEERAVLAELVGVGRIVHRGVVVAKEHNEPIAY